MEPTFENAAKLTLAGLLTKKALEISPELANALTGAAVGGAAGGILPSKSTGNRVLNALLGAGVGGAAGFNSSTGRGRGELEINGKLINPGYVPPNIPLTR